MAGVAVAAVLAALMAALAALPAHAAFPGRNGLVAFSTATGRPPGNIFSMRANGTRRHRLTSRGDSRNPAWSWDGGRIAFDRELHGERALHVMTADGSHVRRVRTGVMQAENPSWSPDGRRLAFQGCRGTDECARPGIFVVRASGGRVRRIARNGTDPVWSPNGRWIAYFGKVGRRDACPTLARVRPSGRARRAILPRRRDSHNVCSWGGNGADFSPNGRRLVYFGLRAASFEQHRTPSGQIVRVWTYDPAMYTVRANGRGRRVLATRSIEKGQFFALPFVWSPNGDRLLWRDDRGTFIADTRARHPRRVRGLSGVGYAWQSRRR